MSLKRRRFVQNLLVAPAVPAALAAQQTTTTPKEQAPPQPNTPAVQNPQQPKPIGQLKLTQVDLTAETAPHFFSEEQFATLQALGKVMVPPLKGNPGALDAHAPEFLDFLISESPADRQTLYRKGLDGLNGQSKDKFQKPFSALSATEADAVLRPLLVIRTWPEDFPSDPLKNFIAQVHDDLRTATVNSREWAEVAGKAPHRFTRGRRGSGLYWAPVDPISGG
jgi:Gluconate 2-dehydrogenase subunit 3